MKKTAILFVIISVLYGCNKKTENVAKSAKDCLLESVTDSVESLIFWTSDTVCSQNPELVKLLDPLYKHVRSDSFPSSMKKELEWMEQYRNQLCTYYDTNHLGSDTIASYAKADTVLNLADRLFDADDDWSTMGMIVNISLQNDFLIYRTAAEASSIHKYEPTFVEELNAWDGFQKALNDFCLSVVNWNWFGGSGAGPASLAEQNTILQCRLDDLKRVHKQYRRDYDMRILSRDDIEKAIDEDYKKAKSEFRATVEKVAKSITKDEDAKEYLSEDRLTDYNELFNKIQKSQKPLMKAFDNWLRVRNHFPKDEGSIQRAARNKQKENTTILIESLSKCITDSQPEG